MENKLTAEEMFERNYVRFKGEYFIPRSDFLICIEEFAAQQVGHATAELREEVAGLSLALDHEKGFASIEKSEFNSMQAEIEHLKTQLTEAQRQRDELKNLCWVIGALSLPNGDVVDGFRTREVVLQMRRLSSGGTKNEDEMWFKTDENTPQTGQNIYIYLDGEVFPGSYDFDGDDVAKFWDANDNPLEHVQWWTIRQVPDAPKNISHV